MKKNLIISLLLVLPFFSCGDEEPRYSVPRSNVYFIVNINIQDKELNAPGGSYKTFTKPRLAKEEVGFGGLLVVHGDVEGTLYAYDLACPKEDSRSSLIVPQKGGVTAICPTCKSEYSIMLGTGHVISGPSEEPLQRYRVFADGNNGQFRIVN